VHSFQIQSSKGNRRRTTGSFRHRARPVRAPGDRGPAHCMGLTDCPRPRPRPSSSPRGGQDRSITRPAHTLSNLRSKGGGLDRQTSEYGGGFRASVRSSDRYKQIEKKGRKGLEEVRVILSRRLDQFWKVLPFTARKKNNCNLLRNEWDQFWRDERGAIFCYVQRLLFFSTPLV
jgi:hypothetical protein